MATTGVRSLMPGEWELQQQQIDRKRKLAEALQQQSMEMPQGQMVSGHYVAANPLQYMAQMLKGYNAKKELEGYDKQQQDVLQQREEASSNAGQKFVELLRGGQIDPMQSEMPTENPDGSTSYGATPTTSPDKNAALSYALSDPNAQRNPIVGAMLPELLKQQGPVKGEVINGQLVNPYDGTLIGKAIPKQTEKKPIVVDGVVLDPDTMQPLYTAPAKPEKPTSDMQEYELAKAQGYRGTFTDYQKELRRAGASNVSVGFPKETFKNERDLRNDFQGLPTTKAFREVQTAYDQITTALKNPSAANDLAAATKFMKLLDPGSVVRESELAMAMEATGKLDQLNNYFNRLKTGQKLTVTQRKDFAQSAQALYNAAAGRYNEAANEYRGMAGDYQLNPDRVAKPAIEASGPRKTVNGVTYVHDGKGWKKE